ncbi:MAG: T9SS type A sorting domain-containing protein, partial [Candidatus Zixiibacteriota bacterium]
FRAEHIETRIINPPDITEVDGHFVVAVIQILEDPIPPGDGPVFTALFTVSQDAIPGTSVLIDTLFYPPAGKMLLVEAESSTTIWPAYEAGKVLVGSPNRAPSFALLEDQYVLEGDSLRLDITVTDPDDDNLTLAATAKPSAASFVDNGDGTARLIWVPEYIGPNSSDGTPFTVNLWASDGDLSAEEQVTVEVLNANRAPVITAPSAVEVDAGQTLSLEVKATDPDFEQITWSWTSDLSGATFDNNNPGHFQWLSTLSDTGSADIEFVATDPFGFSDTSLVDVTINAATIYTISLDTLEVFPGDEFSFDVSIDNLVPIGGFNILFNYDPTAFTLLSLTNEGTRSEGFEHFEVSYDVNSIPGNTRIVGVADDGGGSPVLASGSGAVTTARFRASGDIGLAGLTVPMRLRFLDAPVNNDNTLTDSLGVKIEQSEIRHKDGYVRFSEIGPIKIGDINLNGIAAEIADVIYFTNHFINPNLYPFNILQYANSDVNGDGIVASISDLVALINWVVSGQPSKPVGAADELKASVTYENSTNAALFSCQTNFEVGGLFISLATEAGVSPEAIINLREEMILDYYQADSLVNLIIYSLSGHSLPPGENILFALEDPGDFKVRTVDMATYDGRYVSVSLATQSENLPSEYELYQNYPNPFNPETNISFAVPTAGHVRLVVYNVLGQAVRTLMDQELSVGIYDVTWDGSDDYDRPVASGVYLYRLEARSLSLSRKMMLLK